MATYPKDRDLHSENNLQNIKRSMQEYEEPEDTVVLNVQLQSINSSEIQPLTLPFRDSLYAELRRLN
jgi:hypothetical protein